MQRPCNGGAGARFGPAARCPARSQLVRQLPVAAQQIFQAAKSDVRCQFLQMVPRLQQNVAHPPRNSVLQVGQVPLKFLSRLHDDFRGGRGRGRAHVRHKIGNREIGFVAHAADDRDGAGGNRARHRFLVERPQIFERSAAARQQ